MSLKHNYGSLIKSYQLFNPGIMNTQGDKLIYAADVKDYTLNNQETKRSDLNHLVK